MNKLAIFASGNGTNAEAIIRHFAENRDIGVALIVSNRRDAFVLERAANHNIPAVVLGRDEFYDDSTLLAMLESHGIDFIVLAGFLWLIPPSLVKAYEGRIVNIHPALLPAYGGKGMYGDRVHKAVKESGDRETGITIHLVNEQYDVGDIIFQARCPVKDTDTSADIAGKVHALEYQYYPSIIESMLKNQ